METNNIPNNIKWGDIYFADLGEVEYKGEISGQRPVVILQNNVGNQNSPTVTIAPITSNLNKKDFPTHLLIEKDEGGMKMDSVVATEQIKTISKERIRFKIGSLSKEKMEAILNRLNIQIGGNNT